MMQEEPTLPVPSKRKHPLPEHGSEIPADHLNQTAEPAEIGEEEQMNEEEVKVKKMKSSGEGEGGTPSEQNDDVVKEFDMAEILVEARQHRAQRDGAKTEGKLPLISIIIPIYNAQRYLDECFASIVRQTYAGPIEVSLYDDGSEDGSSAIIQRWLPVFAEAGFTTQLRRNDRSTGRGCGFAKNRSIEQSTGEYLCFLDADDIMKPERVELQLQAALKHPDSIIGAKFTRTPKGSTERYMRWCNSLTQEELMSHRFREVTIIQPTWFMSRKTFDKVGGYDETFPGCPEDLIFFYAHLGLGGGLHKVDKKLLVYRYHAESTCKAIHRLVLLKVRSQAIQEQVLSKWDSFTIWSVGRDGKKFFNSLSVENQNKVAAFCDIDPKKIGTKHTTRQMKADNVKPIPIIHYTEAKAPIITCVALDRTEGKFERNLAELQLREGIDFLYFV